MYFTDLLTIPHKLNKNDKNLFWFSFVPGYAESHAKLTIKVVLPEKVPAELPIFEEPLTNVKVTINYSRIFVCQVLLGPNL